MVGVKAILHRFLESLVSDGSPKGVPLREWAAPINQKKLVTRGELLSVLKNLKSLTDENLDQSKDA